MRSLIKVFYSQLIFQHVIKNFFNFTPKNIYLGYIRFIFLLSFLSNIISSSPSIVALFTNYMRPHQKHATSIYQTLNNVLVVSHVIISCYTKALLIPEGHEHQETQLFHPDRALPKAMHVCIFWTFIEVSHKVC